MTRAPQVRLPDAAQATKLSRYEPLQQFNSFIKAEESKGVATAAGQKLQWSYNPGRNPANGPATVGNSANAAEVAATGSKVCDPFACSQEMSG